MYVPSTYYYVRYVLSYVSRKDSDESTPDSFGLPLVDIQRYQKLTPYGILVFGVLLIIPGAYHIVQPVRIAAGARDLSWDDIPDFNT